MGPGPSRLRNQDLLYSHMTGFSLRTRLELSEKIRHNIREERSTVQQKGEKRRRVLVATFGIFAES